MTPFWQLEQHAGCAAITPSGRRIGYRDLALAADRLAEGWGPRRQLIFLQASNSLDSLTAYLASLRHGHCLMLLADPPPDPLMTAYRPNWLLSPDGQARHLHDAPLEDDGETALLLSTSGSTGSPKQVALSTANLQANAAAIVDYLAIGPDERAITSLPMPYSYGLSVINSHLLAGARLLLTDASLVSADFWHLFRDQGATSLAGVPTSYGLLERLRLEAMQLTHLRTLTQAGGKLAPDKVRHFARLAQQQGWRFFVMYGQTEAGPRMSYLPPELAEHFPDSIGQPIPGGRFRLLDPQGQEIQEPDRLGELVFTGPSVMLGYASTRADLGRLEHPRELHTGDLACRNDQGLYFIRGRLKRFIKLDGRRLNLDELEQQLQQEGFEVACGGEDDRLIIAHRNATATAGIAQQLQRLGLLARHYRLLQIEDWPLTASGKLAYEQLCKLAKLEPIARQAAC